MAGKEHVDMLNQVYNLFSHTNPMHSDVFPSVRQMESEVVAMTAAMLGGELAALETLFPMIKAARTVCCVGLKTLPFPLQGCRDTLIACDYSICKRPVKAWRSPCYTNSSAFS